MQRLLYFIPAQKARWSIGPWFGKCLERGNSRSRRVVLVTVKLLLLLLLLLLLVVLVAHRLVEVVQEVGDQSRDHKEDETSV